MARLWFGAIYNGDIGLSAEVASKPLACEALPERLPGHAMPRGNSCLPGQVIAFESYPSKLSARTLLAGLRISFGT